MNDPRNLSKEEFRTQYGLKNLREKITNSQPEYAVLEKGVDLTYFGLNLTS